jgi:hypothetical protein
MIFCRGTRNFLDLNPESWIQLRVPNTQFVFVIEHEFRVLIYTLEYQIYVWSAEIMHFKVHIDTLEYVWFLDSNTVFCI